MTEAAPARVGHGGGRLGRAARGERRRGPGLANPGPKDAKGGPGHQPRAASARKCPSLVSDVLLSHGLTPQYHRRWGA